MLRDIRYALRTLIKSPGFAIVASLTLAVGIGANSVIFCVARGLLFPTLRYRDVDGILNLVELHRINGGFASSIPDYLDWKAQSQAFAEMGAVSYGWSTVSGGSEPEDVDTAYVSDGFLPLLGATAAAGRLFLEEEYKPGAAHVMVLGYGFWQRQFGGARDAIGRQLTLAGESYTVVGVTPPNFEESFSTKLFLPLSARKDSIPSDRQNRRSGVFARLKPGITLTEAQREMDVIAERLSRAYPATNTGITVSVLPWRERMTHQFRSMVGVLLGAVALVLLICCVNVANLLMARAASRQREIAIRTALGAGRARLVRQLLTESLVLALFGGLMGILFAFWAMPLLNALYPSPHPFVLDRGILALTTALIAVTALLFGSIPALLMARAGGESALKDRFPAGGPRHHGLRSSLVIAEMALSLMLLYGAALLLRSFLKFEAIDKGFNPRNVLNMVVNVYKEHRPRGSQMVDFGRDVLVQLDRLPGTQVSALATPISLDSRQGNWGITAAGIPADSTGSAPLIDPLAVSPDYFRVMEIPLLRGRPFTPAEAGSGAPVVILSEDLSRRLWPGEDPVGKVLKLETGQPDMPWLTVTGVAREARGHSFFNAAVKASGLYAPFGLIRFGDGWFTRTGGNRDGRYTSLRFYIRSRPGSSLRVDDVRGAVLQVDPDQPIFQVRTMEEKLRLEGSSLRALSVLLGLFASVALLLATVGIYGVMSYSVNERTAEIGLRMALGAQRQDALALVLAQGGRLLALGLLLGLGGAMGLAGLLESQVFGMSPRDPLTLGGAAVVLAAVGMFAAYLPARRAARVDPMVALRSE